MTDEMKARIDEMSYVQLLTKWRHAPIGDPMFQGETGDYVAQRMKELRENGADHTLASKIVGWDPPE